MSVLPAPVARTDPRRHPLRRVLDTLEEGWRWHTAAARALPDYVIIGAQRSGSSYLARALRWHPDVLPNMTGGEIHYFDWHRAQGERWYRMQFPRRTELVRTSRRHGRPVLTGEKTPDYLCHPLAPRWLAELRPDARLVVVLREPVARAWSQWRKNRREGTEDLDFDAALAAEPERTAQGWAALAGGADLGRRHPVWLHSYAARGRYADQLRSWFEWFPVGQVLVVRAEDLYAKPEETYHRTLEFLGLELSVAPDPPPSGDRWTAAGDVPPALANRHGPGFRDANRDLADLVGITWP